MFNNGKLKLRCSASIFNVYHRSEERSIEHDRRNHRSAIALHASTTTTEFPMREYKISFTYTFTYLQLKKRTFSMK